MIVNKEQLEASIPRLLYLLCSGVGTSPLPRDVLIRPNTRGGAGLKNSSENHNGEMLSVNLI